MSSSRCLPSPYSEMPPVPLGPVKIYTGEDERRNPENRSWMRRVSPRFVFGRRRSFQGFTFTGVRSATSTSDERNVEEFVCHPVRLSMSDVVRTHKKNTVKCVLCVPSGFYDVMVVPAQRYVIKQYPTVKNSSLLNIHFKAGVNNACKTRRKFRIRGSSLPQLRHLLGRILFAPQLLTSSNVPLPKFASSQSELTFQRHMSNGPVTLPSNNGFVQIVLESMPAQCKTSFSSRRS